MKRSKSIPSYFNQFLLINCLVFYFYLFFLRNSTLFIQKNPLHDLHAADFIDITRCLIASRPTRAPWFGNTFPENIPPVPFPVPNIPRPQVP